MKILTLPQTIAEIRKIDPDSSINETMLNCLIKEKKLSFGRRGIRTVVEWNTLIASLNSLLGFFGETFLPHIRTVRKAALELKMSKSDIGVGESHIRAFIADKKIGFISIGNRHYVAMQSFQSPYSDNLAYGISPSRVKQQYIQENIIEQLDSAISSSAGVPMVRRKRK